MSSDLGKYQVAMDLLKVCIQQNIPFAAYRTPQQKNFQIMVQYKSVPRKLDSIADFKAAKGFVVAPFSVSDVNSIFILEPDLILNDDEIDTENLKLLSGIRSFIDQKKPCKEAYITTSKTDFINQVNAAKDAICKAEFHKVVLSKIRKETLDSNFDAAIFFVRLCEQYPAAFVSVIQLPEVGRWIGATPEQMLVANGDSIKTESLAGTQIATNAPLENYRWSKKEIEEQAIVTDYVQHTLKLAHIENYQLSGPTNHQAGNLIHLKTSFEFNLSNSKSNFSDVLKALHPTPSVGGMPKTEACRFILNNEKHDRKYYAGFLGPVNIDKESKLFVNLRCLQLIDNEFILYSGAGITAGSDAEKEWDETENKMRTLRNVLNC